jgi:hypothetical protein
VLRGPIACARPNVLKIFELAGLDGMFAIFPTLDEALAHARENEALGKLISTGLLMWPRTDDRVKTKMLIPFVF